MTTHWVRQQSDVTQSTNTKSLSNRHRWNFLYRILVKPLYGDSKFVILRPKEGIYFCIQSRWRWCVSRCTSEWMRVTGWQRDTTSSQSTGELSRRWGTVWQLLRWRQSVALRSLFVFSSFSLLCYFPGNMQTPDNTTPYHALSHAFVCFNIHDLEPPYSPFLSKSSFNFTIPFFNVLFCVFFSFSWSSDPESPR